MNPTIKDIAREAQVSYATVSRALNNKYGVKPATRARITEIARRLNYSPNAIARGLVTRRTKSVGLILPDITNPFFPEVARGVEEGAQECGYSVFLCNTNWELRRERQYIKLLAEKRVDGLVLAPISNDAASIDREFSRDIPVVYVSNAPKRTVHSYVEIDNKRGGYIATAHLIESGYRQIGFIGAISGSPLLDERLEGFRKAHERYGIPVAERFIRMGNFRQQTGYEITATMIESGDLPRAIFAENDIIALGVLQALREHGLSVPDDVAVAGFDDIPIASYPEVRLTTVYQPKYEMGKIGVQLLVEEIAARLGEEPRAERWHRRHVVLEPRLVVRGTSPAPGAPAEEGERQPEAAKRVAAIAGCSETREDDDRAVGARTS